MNIPLRDLEPSFLKISDATHFEHIDDLARADGVMFLCPKCFEHNGGSVGTHSVVCWQPHVGQEHPPTPGRWKLEGTSYDDLSLVAGSSSVWLKGAFCVRPGCPNEHVAEDSCPDPRCAGWHGNVVNGMVTGS